MPSFYLVIVGTIINGLGALYYVLQTLRGKIKPNRVSFFFWAIAPVVAFSAERHQGVGIESLMTISLALFTTLIFLSSFFNKKSYWKLTSFDLSCGALAFLGLLLWYLTKVGNLAIFFSILADLLAAIPTLTKTYNFPKTESPWPWLAAFIQALLTLIALQSWNFQNYGYPLYNLVLTFIIFCLARFKFKRV